MKELNSTKKDFIDLQYSLEKDYRRVLLIEIRPYPIQLLIGDNNCIEVWSTTSFL